jgi:N-acetylmuramic acid 6-phosphate etherase
MPLKRNPNTVNIDKANSLEIVEMMNNEDKKVALEVEKAEQEIANGIDMMYDCLKNDGRVIYVGSGTSGKLAVIDASECPPTFGVDDNMIIGLISGGAEAVAGWKEETEDNAEMAVNDLKKVNFSSKDILVAVSASGNTPYAVSAINYAKELSAKTIGIYCSLNSVMENIVDNGILINVGPEVIAGSTRLKAGTAQKMVLNMLSTGVMIRLGYVYSNLMINVKPINQKLKDRLVDIVSIITEKSADEVREKLEETAYDAKQAIEDLKS